MSRIASLALATLLLGASSHPSLATAQDDLACGAITFANLIGAYTSDWELFTPTGGHGAQYAAYERFHKQAHKDLNSPEGSKRIRALCAPAVAAVAAANAGNQKIPALGPVPAEPTAPALEICVNTLKVRLGSSNDVTSDVARAIYADRMIRAVTESAWIVPARELCNRMLKLSQEALAAGAQE
jgi:hypothetical protein